ncbi:MAG: LytR/AlgR family response regulator transcription factor [Leadbetterella sp.]
MKTKKTNYYPTKLNAGDLLLDESKKESVFIGSRQSIENQTILYLESDINYTKVYLVGGQIILSSTNLGKIEKRFSSNHPFIRISRGVVVNQKYIQYFHEKHIELINKVSLTVSRRRIKNLCLINK